MSLGLKTPITAVFPLCKIIVILGPTGTGKTALAISPLRCAATRKTPPPPNPHPGL